MFSIVITERGGAQRLLDFEAPEVSIGRLEDNDVVLPRSNVSKRHARLVLKDERYVLIDLKSTNGTYLNGRKITTPMMVGAGDKVYIGDFILALQDSPKLEAAQARLRERPATQPVASLRPQSTEPLAEPGLGGHGSAPEPLPPRRTAPPPPPPPPPPTPPPPPPPPVPHQQAPAAAFTAAVPTTLEAPQPRQPMPWPSMPQPQAPAHLPSSAPPPPVPTSTPPPPTLAPESVDVPDPLREDRVTPDPRDEGPTVERLRRVSGLPTARGSVPPRVQDPESGQGPATSPAVLAPSVRLQGALQSLMERLGNLMDVTEPRERAFPSDQQDALQALVDDLADEGVLGPDLDRRFLIQAAVSEAVGLGPLDRLLNNRAVREVVVDGPARILADLGGGLSPVSSFFSSSLAVHTALRRLCARAGRELGNQPVEELELPDGSQVQVLLPPLSPSGPLISIRCPPRAATSADALITEGVLSIDMLQLLRAAVQRRVNALVVGPVSAGVSTILSALASLCQDHERIVTLQRAPTLAIRHPHVLPLNQQGARGKHLGQLLRHAARLRGDRLVIDDVQGEDALYVLHTAASMRGVLAGMHAPSPAAALEQIEMFAQVALGGSRASLASLIAAAFQLIVQISADPGGTRRVLCIAELRGGRDNTLELAPLYRYDGGFKPTEQRASFLAP